MLTVRRHHPPPRFPDDSFSIPAGNLHDSQSKKSINVLSVNKKVVLLPPRSIIQNLSSERANALIYGRT